MKETRQQAYKRKDNSSILSNKLLSNTRGVEETTEGKGNKDKIEDDEEEHGETTLLTNTQSVP